jgi:hypothetical protein
VSVNLALVSGTRSFQLVHDPLHWRMFNAWIMDHLKCDGQFYLSKTLLQLQQIGQKRLPLFRRRRPVNMDSVRCEDRCRWVVQDNEPEERVVMIEDVVKG